MAIHPDIRDQAYQFFTEEATGLLQVIETGLLTLNQERSTAKIHSLMRAAHSLKGGAAGVGLEVIATLAHRLENIFKALYHDSLATDPALENWLLQAYDCLRLPLSQQIAVGSFDATQALAMAEPIFSQIEAYCGDALTQTDSYMPSSDEMGVDMVLSIFEIDVAQGLEQLAMAMLQPGSDLLGELQMQAEVFAGFAELLNLPNFGAIAQTVQQAVMLHPEFASEIAQLALSEFEQSRAAVLAGDRSGGAAPSAALLRFAIEQNAAAQNPAAPSDELSPALELPTSLQFLEPLLEKIDISNEYDLASDILDIDLSAINRQLFDPDHLPQLKPSEPLAQSPIFSLPAASPETIANQSTVNLTPTETPLTTPLTTPNIPPATAPIAAPIEPNIRPNFSSNFSWQSPPRSANSSASLTVRVDAERLERMNNLVGELSINRSSLALQNTQLHRVLRRLRQRFEQFQTLVTKLHRPEPQREWAISASFQQPRFELPAYSTPIEFDVLEMDRYGAADSELQDILEELVQLEESVDDISLFTRQSSQTLEHQQHRLIQLRDELVWARMLPLSEVLNRFPRILRDLSVTYQKPASLTFTGAELLIDRAILEKLYDPLLHLLRNAFDHGIEPPALRQQRAKPAQGQIEIRALHQGNQTIIEVRDDGQGIDRERICERVRELGWFSAEQIAMLSESELTELIFEPGFSTAAQVSELSGRGFGLDVVRSDLKAIRGQVSVVSRPGQGTTFTLALPLTLTITQLIICWVGKVPVALPADSIADILVPQQMTGKDIRQGGEQNTNQNINQNTNQVTNQATDQIQWRDQIIPVYAFADLLHYACPLPEAVASQLLAAFPAPKDWAAPVIVMRREDQFFGLAVERIITEQELVIKPFGAALASPSYLYGCTILGEGSAVPVIDAAALLARSLQPADLSLPGAILAAPPAVQPPAVTIQAPAILVVDDAITLRRTLALFLEREGFRVLQAQDGQEALDQLQQTAVQLVVCDIEMPNMNGFEFLNARRQDPQLAQIPVVILTSRSNEKHRWLALRLGADAYFTKPYLEQEFLTALQALTR